MLTIRQENISKLQSQHSKKIHRDPFNWSDKQIAHFRESDIEKRAALFSGLSLTGIIWDVKKPLAIINGKMLGTGETINGATILKINKENVLLSKSGTQYTLEFEASIVGITPR